MKKTIFFWLYFIVAIVLATYFLTRFITSKMGRGPISSVHNVKITSDVKNADFKTIEMTAGISHGISLKTLDLNQITNRVLNIAEIKDASTRRLPNGNLIIKTKQHKAVAMWSDGAYFYPLSEDGTKIETPLETHDEHTIVFRGEIPNNVKEIINDVSILSPYIDYIIMVESRRLDIHTKSGMVIYLPEENPSVAVHKINELNKTHKLLSRDISVLDMRDEKRILVK
ncbi:MAG: cell division protein FtsQ/DivIB [Alphaproteobacteria bacterium]|nr:cell division protein FtsQ/DivIB [Alphaproteobacteria bacterium]